MFRFDIYESNRNEELPEKVSFFKDFIISKGGVFDSSHPDIVFVFGGDGSLLNAIKIHSAHLTSFMLINAGTLGFYREYDLNELDKFYKEFDFDKLVREEHKLLEIDDIYGNKAFAVNEVMLASSIKTLDFNVYVNDKYLMEVKGSGICIATPFGSSGYNHSLGASLLVGNKGMILSLLAPIHNKAIHPLINSIVIQDNDSIRLEVRNDVHFELAGDMKFLDNLQGNSFTISKSNRSFYLAHTKVQDEYQRIRQSFVD